MTSPAAGQRAMKIVRVIARLNVGGPAIHTILLTEALSRNGWQTVLVKGQEGACEGDMMELARAKGVSPLLFPELAREIAPLADLRSLWRLLRVLWRERPDVLHTHTAKAGAVGRGAVFLYNALARVTGRRPAKVFHTFHGHVFHGYFSPEQTRWFLAIERWLARHSTALITLSEGLKRELVELGVAPAEKFRVVPLGLELKRFAQARQGTLRSELGLTAGAPLVGWVGRLVNIKAVDQLLLAARIVADRLPEARFALIGDGELRGRLEAQAKDLGLTHAVHFLGFRFDLERLYPDLDVVTLSSLNEGTPVSLIEAMAAGRAVAATRVGGVPDLIEHGRTGLLVPPQDPEAMAGAILTLLGSPELRRQMGERGRERVYPGLDISRLVADLKALYTS